MITIKLNGEPKELSSSQTIRDLLDDLAVSGPVAVELNRKVCPKAYHDEIIIKENDEIEIVTIVGGG